MLEVLLFAFSVSIDAIGLSINFGSRNFAISKLQFLALNILNTSVLTLFLVIFPYVSFMNAPWLGKVGSSIMLCLGLWYITESFVKVFKSLSNNHLQSRKKLNGIIKFITLKEYFVLIFFFIAENVVSTIIFYGSLSYPVLFILATFFFHHMAFTIGYDLGDKLTKILPIDSSFISGVVFVILGFINFFE